MTAFIANLIGNSYLATAIMSLIPLIELKGGIVFARGAGLGTFEAFGLAYAGSTLVFIPIFFLLIPILNGLKKLKWFNKLACKAESYVQSKADGAIEKRKAKNKSSKMSETLLKQIAVFIFVAIPLPMTGVWMGTAIAVFLGLKFKDAILPIVLGNLVAGLLITGLAELCIALSPDFATASKVLDIVLYVLFGIAIIGLIILIVKLVLQKPKTVKTETAEGEISDDTNAENVSLDATAIDDTTDNANENINSQKEE